MFTTTWTLKFGFVFASNKQGKLNERMHVLILLYLKSLANLPQENIITRTHEFELYAIDRDNNEKISSHKWILFLYIYIMLFSDYIGLHSIESHTVFSKVISHHRFGEQLLLSITNKKTASIFYLSFCVLPMSI